MLPYQPAIFDDLSHEALALCRHSLIAASQTLSAREGKQIDGALFLVRHLLILKETTSAVETVRREKEMRGGGELLGVTGEFEQEQATLGDDAQSD